MSFILRCRLTCRALEKLLQLQSFYMSAPTSSTRRQPPATLVVVHATAIVVKHFVLHPRWQSATCKILLTIREKICARLQHTQSNKNQLFFRAPRGYYTYTEGLCGKRRATHSLPAEYAYTVVITIIIKVKHFLRTQQQYIQHTLT